MQNVAIGSKDKLRFSFREWGRWLTRRILRRIRWRQSGSRRYRLLSPRFSTRQVIHDCEGDAHFLVRVRSVTDLLTLEMIFAAEDYRLQRLNRYEDIFNQYLEICVGGKAPLIVDCGANAGFSALYFSRAFPKATVIGVEPDEENIALARENCSSHSNVRFLHAGVAARSGRAELLNPGLGAWGYRTVENPLGRLNLISIGDVLAETAETTVPFIAKIDIEGFEENLFFENTEWVDRFPLLIIELHDWMLPNSASSGNFLRCISALDRDFVYHGENVFSLRNARSAQLPASDR